MAFERIHQQATAIKVCSGILLAAGILNVIVGIVWIVTAISIAESTRYTLNSSFWPLVIATAVIVFVKALLALFTAYKGYVATRDRDPAAASVFRILAYVLCGFTLINLILGGISLQAFGWPLVWWCGDIVFTIFAGWIGHKFHHSLLHGEALPVVGVPGVVVTTQPYGAVSVVVGQPAVVTAYAQPGYAYGQPAYSQPAYSQPGYAYEQQPQKF